MVSQSRRVDPAEWQLRCDLAACYRLVAAYGWTDLIYGHVWARLPGGGRGFLLNPLGLLFEEITASSLVAVDQEGRKLDDSPHEVNPAGFVIHSALHAGREDIGCVLHTHTRAGIAVSAQRNGLLPISQQASFVLASLGTHEYEGTAVRDEEKPRLRASLGDKDYLLMRNHGLITVGPSIADAFLRMYIFESACQIQVAAQAGGAELVAIEGPILASVERAVRAGSSGLDGHLAWPALLRRLDRINPGYRS
jgi:ribulose-5-phosphate 4-epimerase/fuculose-1-phosphate aldolase